MKHSLLLLILLVFLGACATPPGPTRPGLTEEDRVVRLQVYLDNQNFGPGVIDGRLGEFTSKAAHRLLLSRGLPMTDDLDELERLLPLGQVDPIYTVYEIREADTRQVGEVPRRPEDQAKLRRLPYRSLHEFVAEKFHSDRAFLARLNRDLDMNHLRPGDRVKVPNVGSPFRIESLETGKTLPRRSELVRRVIEIDTRSRMLEVYDGNQLLAAFPITPGSANLPAPPGTWRIDSMTLLPWFRRDEKMLKEGERSDDYLMIPPGPNSPVGVIWMGLNRRGIGLHGTDGPETIGRAASHGCVRLANWDAIKLSRIVSAGCPVKIDLFAVTAPQE